MEQAKFDWVVMARASEEGTKRRLCPLRYSHRGSVHQLRTTLPLLQMLQGHCRSSLREEIRKRCSAVHARGQHQLLGARKLTGPDETQAWEKKEQGTKVPCELHRQALDST